MYLAMRLVNSWKTRFKGFNARPGKTTTNATVPKELRTIEHDVEEIKRPSKEVPVPAEDEVNVVVDSDEREPGELNEFLVSDIQHLRSQ